MLTYEAARKIGVDACIDKLGRDFVMRYQNTSSSGFGDRGDHAMQSTSDKNPLRHCISRLCGVS